MEIVLLSYECIESKTDESGNYTTVISVSCALSGIPGVTWNMTMPAITHSNSQTGQEVDDQRKAAVNQFIAGLNNN